MSDWQGLLDALAERFGTSVAHLWDVFAWQVRFTMFVEVAGVVGTVILVALRLKVREIMRRRIRDDYDFEIAWILFNVLLLTAAIGAMAAGIDAINRLLNPEYFIIGKIVGGIR